MTSASYFTALGDGRYRATEHAGSAWGDDGLHFSPVAGLLTHHLEQWRGAHADGAKTIGRVSFDILGRIADDEIEIETRVLRPGRTIELLETTASIQGRPTITARAWALSDVDTSAVAGDEWALLPSPDGLTSSPVAETWPGGYIRSIDVRHAGEPRPGRAAAWITTEVALVDGEEAGPLASYVALIDTANGIAVREHPSEWMFPNLDLTIHFFRRPEGRWNGFDTTVTFGPSGQGLTSSVLYDLAGPVGTAQQLLTVRPNTAPLR
ncbi:thioesterase family protein [Agromyces sp. NPDC058136]|uniref:thioesterase family protein n=1 Tax=Agromyces sp. NPDC058136 TaxID=3346354 RepID=UPI0036DB05B2